MKTNFFSNQSLKSVSLSVFFIPLFLSLSSDANAAAKTKKGWLGVQIQELTPTLKEALKVGDRKGLLISEVIDGSPADKAGLEDEDVILTYDGKQVEKSDEFAQMVKKTEPKKVVKIKILREGKEQTIVAKIGKKKRLQYIHEGDQLFAKFFSFKSGGPKLGIKVQPLNKDLAAYFKVDADEGVLVLEVTEDSPAEKGGLKAGDVLKKIDDEEVANPEELIEALEEYEEGDALTVEYVRRGKSAKAEIELEEIEDAKSYHFKMKKPKYHIRKFSPGGSHDIDIIVPEAPGHFKGHDPANIIIKKKFIGVDSI